MEKQFLEKIYADTCVTQFFIHVINITRFLFIFSLFLHIGVCSLHLNHIVECSPNEIYFSDGQKNVNMLVLITYKWRLRGE